MSSLTKVVVDDLYGKINDFVTTNEISVDDYDSMVEVVLRMIKEGYCFTMDRDILRDAMECLTYMYSPSDDMNKDRVVQQLCDGGDDSDDEDDEDGESDDGSENGFGNMDLLKMMQMMGAPMQREPMNDTTESNGDECSNECPNECPNEASDECKEVTCEEGRCAEGKCEDGTCEDGECKKVITNVVKEEELVPDENVE